jgi:hypothetical protein
MNSCAGCATEISVGLARRVACARELAGRRDELAAALIRRERADAAERRRVAREPYRPRRVRPETAA